MKRGHWTSEEVEFLERHRSFTSSWIAKRLDRKPDSVWSKRTWLRDGPAMRQRRAELYELKALNEPTALPEVCTCSHCLTRQEIHEWEEREAVRTHGPKPRNLWPYCLECWRFMRSVRDGCITDGIHVGNPKARHYTPIEKVISEGVE